MAETNRAGESRGSLQRVWSRLWNSPWPTLGCEISHTGVSVARWSGDSSRPETVAWKPIPSGAIEASPLRENIRRPEDVRQAWEAALGSLGISGNGESSRHGTESILLIPDQAARLFVLSFDALPQRSSDALPLIKWRLKKSVPFEIDSAAISYYAQRLDEQWQVVAVATPQSVVRQYEALAESFGLRPRFVILSTLAALGTLRESGAEETGRAALRTSPAAIEEKSAREPFAGRSGVLVGKYSPPWFSTAIVQGGRLRLFRTVGIATDGEGLAPPASVLEALYPSLAYFHDNLGGLLEKAYVSGLGANGPEIVELLRRELDLEVAPLLGDLSLGATGLDPYQEERYFASLLGVVRGYPLG